MNLFKTATAALVLATSTVTIAVPAPATATPGATTATTMSTTIAQSSKKQSGARSPAPAAANRKPPAKIQSIIDVARSGAAYDLVATELEDNVVFKNVRVRMSDTR